MPQTNLQKGISYYERVIADSKNSPLSSKYETMCSLLEGLVTLSKKLNKPEVKMSPQVFTELNEKYKTVKEACRDYLGAEKFDSFEQSRKGIVEHISRTLTKDMAILGQCNPMEPGSLSEVISKSRTHTIHLKDSDIKTEGGALSRRIPLKTPSGRKGFFTPNTTYNMDEKWVEQINKHVERLGKYSEDYKNRLERLKTDEKMIDFFCTYCPPRPMDEYLKIATDKALTHKMIRNVAKIIGIKDYDKQKNEVKEEVWAFIDSMALLANQYGIMQVSGIKKNSNITDRNCAMTDMARLLGCTGILANSAPMKVVIDGKEVEGVFMETVEGTDICRFKEDDEIFSADEESFENASEALGQIVDLQVLDYICGNTDRHAGNMIYQFDRNQDGKVVLKGIKGIDNDCSFGTPNIEKGHKIQQMVNPEDMQFIREDMLKKIVSLKKDEIDMQLSHYRLADEEKDAVWKRVENVREAVKQKKITVIGKDHWELNSFKFTKTEKDNYLKNMKDMSECCGRKGYEREERGDNEVAYVQDTRMANKVMFGKMDDIVKLREQMNNAKSIIYDSGEFKLMKKGFEKIEKLTKEIRNNYAKAEFIPGEKTAELEAAYTELSDNAYKYIQLKKLVPSTGRGQKRLDFAQNLLDFANDTLHASKSDPEKKTEERNKATMEKQETVKEAEELDMGKNM